MNIILESASPNTWVLSILQNSKLSYESEYETDQTELKLFEKTYHKTTITIPLRKTKTTVIINDLKISIPAKNKNISILSYNTNENQTNNLWEAIEEQHISEPYDITFGGGSQVWGDGVWETSVMKEFLSLSNEDKVKCEFSDEMRKEVTAYYESLYSEFTSPLGIPAIYQIDEHEIWDGWGSNNEEIESCSVFVETFRIAKQTYSLFQQHTTTPPSKPHNNIYIFNSTLLLSLDTRTERTQHQIIHSATLNNIKEEVTKIIKNQKIKNIITYIPIPIVFPDMSNVDKLLDALPSDRDRNIESLIPAIKDNSKFGTYDHEDELLDSYSHPNHVEETEVFLTFLNYLQSHITTDLILLSGNQKMGGYGLITNEYSEADTIQQWIAGSVSAKTLPYTIVEIIETFRTTNYHNWKTKIYDLISYNSVISINISKIPKGKLIVINPKYELMTIPLPNTKKEAIKIKSTHDRCCVM